MNASDAPPAADRTRGLAARLWRYQAERFPLAAYAPLIGSFALASASFSRAARRHAGDATAAGLVPFPLLAAGVTTALVCFFVLRVLDEHKDADVDRRWRPELPVPRGLVSLAELRVLAIVLATLVVAVNAALAPVLLLPLALAAAWMALMTREFFVRTWLRAHAGAYLVTHMLVMPMIDAYTTGVDWLVAAGHAPAGLPWFLAATFLNGALVEVGRKLHAPHAERAGVDSYTQAWGLRRAPLAWLLTLAGAAACVTVAARATGTAVVAATVTWPVAVALSVPAWRFLATRDERAARRIEVVSGVWGIVSYLTLGGAPLVARALGR